MIADFRSKTRLILFAITGIVITIFIFGIIVELIGVTGSDFFLVGWIRDAASFFSTPFKGIVTVPANFTASLNIDLIVAICGYLLCSVLITNIITSFIHNNFKDIFQHVVDGLFKILEVLMVLKILFELFAILNLPQSPTFVQLVYGLTQWSNIADLKIPFSNGFIDIFAMILLAVIVILDIVTERFFNFVFVQVGSVFAKSNFSLNLPRFSRSQEQNISSVNNEVPGNSTPMQAQELVPEAPSAPLEG